MTELLDYFALLDKLHRVSQIMATSRPTDDAFALGALPPAGTAPLAGVSTASVHLLGTVDFESCLALQQRLVYETSGRRDGPICLLLCEHPACVTIGRQGSRAELHFEPDETAHRQLPIRWVNRGGPSLLHAPGQLAVYPIVPLDRLGWTVGEYLDRLESGLQAALLESGFPTDRQESHRGLWARSGQVAAVGVAVKGWISYYGAYVNISPPMHLVRRVTSDSLRNTPLSSLVVERSRPVRMQALRERVVRHLAAAFGVVRHHVHAGHPLLGRRPTTSTRNAARAG